MTDLAAPARSTRPLPTAAAFALAVVTASVVAGLLCLAVAAGAHALGASRTMTALTPMIFIPFVVVGVLCGAVGWSIIRARTRHPGRVLSRLVPVVVLLSFIPDVLVGVSRALPGTTWTGVVGLMAMHVVVAVCAVLAYRTFLPVGPPHPLIRQADDDADNRLVIGSSASTSTPACSSTGSTRPPGPD